jgi:hypothetical protein
MRTTVTIDDHLLRAAKQRALEREMTLGSLIEDALRLTLDHAHEGKDKQRRPPLPLSKRRGGARPGVEVADGARLRDLMDAG